LCVLRRRFFTLRRDTPYLRLKAGECIVPVRADRAPVGSERARIRLFRARRAIVLVQRAAEVNQPADPFFEGRASKQKVGKVAHSRRKTYYGLNQARVAVDAYRYRNPVRRDCNYPAPVNPTFPIAWEFGALNLDGILRRAPIIQSASYSTKTAGQSGNSTRVVLPAMPTCRPRRFGK